MSAKHETITGCHTLTGNGRYATAPCSVIHSNALQYVLIDSQGTPWRVSDVIASQGIPQRGYCLLYRTGKPTIPNGLRVNCYTKQMPNTLFQCTPQQGCMTPSAALASHHMLYQAHKIHNQKYYKPIMMNTLSACLTYP